MKLRKYWNMITHWEKWDYRVKYIPLMPAWLWYCLRSGSMWFFTPSNPTLTFGGFEGESKREMYNQLPPFSYPKSIYVLHDSLFEEVEKQLVSSNLQYPFAVKPDVGMGGFLFRKIDNVNEFRQYHEKMPVEYIVQELIDFPLEVSVFYYRFPNEEKGTISGLIKKEMMEIKGDNIHSIEELILMHPRAGFRLKELKSKHENRLQEIMPAGEVFKLSWAANLSRGAKLVTLAHEADDRLLKVFDELSHFTKSFYYGRYDIKCQSIEDLKEGKNFSILEYNGSGAEPHHIYGSGNNLFQAYKILLHHWKVLYEISKYNHRNGARYWKFRPGWQFLKAAKKHFKILRELDAQAI
ncbi:MAG: hypothetical protein WKF89_17195 [Chitinophagaceae bacterium]